VAIFDSSVLLLLTLVGVQPGDKEVHDAIERVKQIVNQPVEALPRDPRARVSLYSPGWFHPGALKPDFLNVDVRKTQQLSYERHEYVSSDLNPGVMFRGGDLEFNPMTKYFYTDRSLPKKRLSEAEMLEINRLYRIIARAEPAAAPDKAATPVPTAGFLASTPAYYLAALLILVLSLVLYRRRTNGRLS
jgi:hypothetical protein